MTPKPSVVVRPKLEVMYGNVACAKCGKRVHMVWDDMSGPKHGAAFGLQPFNGLHLTNHYGFGMKWDHDMFAPPSREIVLCEPCTDKFLVDNHWLERYLSQ